MTVLVCGGRDFLDGNYLRLVLDRLHDKHNFTRLIHGGARGADSLAGNWAMLRCIARQSFPAKWEVHGKAAGPIRNAEMLAEKPSLVVAFPGGHGTADMVRRAKAAGVEVIEVPHPAA